MTSAPSHTTIVTSKHRKMLGGTATFPHIAAPTLQRPEPGFARSQPHGVEAQRIGDDADG
ncbi:hypothetical protein GCM10009081_17440 [Brevundimonas nasdae]